MKIPFEWEEISNLQYYRVYRAKIFGGWIVSSSGYVNKVLITDSTLFIPDPNHEWEI